MPRISQQEKEYNRRTILDAASVLFREYGVDQVGIDQLMNRAGLTRGGFYNHFDSKEALIAEACRCAFIGTLGDLDRFAGEADVSDSKPPLMRVIERYLSLEHRDALGSGCPAPALGADISRHGAEAQSQYAVGVEAYVKVLSDLLVEPVHEDSDLRHREAEPPQCGTYGSDASSRDRALETFALMVGAVVIARAVRIAEPLLSEDVLRVARDAVARQS